MHAAGLLEFQRRLVGDGRGRATAEDEQRIVRRPVRRRSAIQSQPIALLKCFGQAGECRQQLVVAGAVRHQREAGDRRIDEGLRRRDAAFGPGKDVDGDNPRRRASG